MVQLPHFLKPFEKEAEKYLSKDLVKDVEFSGGTYQVQMMDIPTQKEVWAFLQLDNRGQIRDSFCSCEESEEIHDCVHQAVAFLYIFHGQSSPLHHRFERSLWNCLCRLYADRMGYLPSLLYVIDKGFYVCKSIGGKIVFSVKGKTHEAEARLKAILIHRQKETEETSLKFSNLSQEELMLWRQGKPTAQLSYELSFWNDLAKWMMLCQDQKIPYEISFDYSSKKLPNQIRIEFPEIA
jgi:hypothetical protein